MKRHLVLGRAVAVVLLLVLCLTPLALAGEKLTKQDLVRRAESRIAQIDVVRAKALWDKGGVWFLDLREPREFRSGHIPGALNIPRGWLEFRIDDLVNDREADIVLYCRSGDRSCLGTLSINEMGYVNAVNLDGGWLAWDAARYPVQ